MRVLVTGASGLLGLNLALEASKEHTVFGQTNRHRLNTGAFTTLQVDLLEPGAVERMVDEAQPDWIINCAALAVVDACETDPVRARQLNTEVPAKLADYVARGGARLLHVSTDAVFDGLRGDYSEEDQPNPLGVYARTKLDGEREVLAANPQAAVARVNLFGWSLSGKRSLAEFFFYNLQDGKTVMGFTDVYFCPMLVNDLALVLLKMLDKGLSGLYHAVSSECASKYRFGRDLAEQFGLDGSLIRPTLVSESGLKAARSPNLTLRSDKLARVLGEPLPKISTGIRRLYALYQQGYQQEIQRLGSE